MSGIHLRNIPAGMVALLKRRATAHGRSPHGEIRMTLARDAKVAPPREGYPSIRLHQVEVGGSQCWSREETYGDKGR